MSRQGMPAAGFSRTPPLRSGVMLGYSCNQACRHCNYRSAPNLGAWMDEATLALVMDALAGERRLANIHLAGGEATLNPELLLKAIRLALARGVRISYLETNGFFADSRDRALTVLSPLRDAGLTRILLSVSPYHNEFIPLRNTLNCLEAGLETFGDDGVFPWLDLFLPMLARLDPDQPHRLEEFLSANGLAPGDRRLLYLFPLTPGGRVPERLGAFFPRRPAEEFRSGNCREILDGVAHFHIDPGGNLFTGHCPGIIAGHVPDWHLKKTPESHPVFATLAEGGPYALARLANRSADFWIDSAGYASPCDLCLRARQALVRHSPASWPELGPALYYRD